eukprot:TRINITY_DN4265_c0_g1_i4.p2 TRINITY_DN4265_c0_g1~~TRINITY_DN4265_c0_g1_i4.p2  ORF type:complete len:219 (+),score=45.97 TRINITY_DN4265_c0_g1_i4:63-719(+)
MEDEGPQSQLLDGLDLLTPLGGPSGPCGLSQCSTLSMPLSQQPAGADSAQQVLRHYQGRLRALEDSNREKDLVIADARSRIRLLQEENHRLRQGQAVGSLACGRSLKDYQRPEATDIFEFVAEMSRARGATASTRPPRTKTKPQPGAAAPDPPRQLAGPAATDPLSPHPFRPAAVPHSSLTAAECVPPPAASGAAAALQQPAPERVAHQQGLKRRRVG